MKWRTGIYLETFGFLILLFRDGYLSMRLIVSILLIRCMDILFVFIINRLLGRMSLARRMSMIFILTRERLKKLSRNH